MSVGLPESHWVYAASLDDFAAQRKLVRTIDGINILLCRYGSEIAALHNHCTHLGKPLDGGRIMGGQITCPFHGACFDLKTGSAVSGPAVYAAHVFPVRIEAEKIYVNLSEWPASGSSFPGQFTEKK
jgi:3-phenylpropionate/trans-cinnamate dioxygenase ferredoxin component